MVGITISNEDNVQDKAIGISFRRKDQITPDVIWSVFGKVAQSNARFNALDKLVLTVHYVKMPIGNGGGITTKGRPLDTMIHLKTSIVKVKAENNCLAHALVIAVARLTNDPNYKAYIQGYKIRPVVDHLLATTGIDRKSTRLNSQSLLQISYAVFCLKKKKRWTDGGCTDMSAWRDE
jgi:hypothetical protein